MAVIAIKLIDYEDNFSGGKPSKQKTYLVQTDDFTTGSVDARMAVAALPVDTGFIITTLNAKPKPNPLWFEVQLGLESPPTSEEENPLLRPSILSGSYNEFLENYFKDADDTLVITSSLERFENFPQRPNGNPVLQVTKNLETFPAVTYDALKYTRNAEPVTIAGTTYDGETLLFQPPTVQEVYEKGSFTTYHYFATTFRLAADHGLHLHNVEDRGYFKLVSGVQKPILIGPTKIPPTTPYPLDGSGNPQASAGDAPAIKTFKPHPTASWGLDFS